MLIINDQFYTAKDFDRFTQQLNDHPIWRKADRWRIAVCPEDLGKWVMLLYYIKEKQASIVPIHPSTPVEAAKRIANEAGCFYLFYQSFESPLTLNQAESISEPGMIQFSSGTTGQPKRIVRSWASIDDELRAYRDMWHSIDVNTVIVACPITHSYGLISGVMAGIDQGKTVVVVTAQNPNYVLSKTKDYPKHVLYASPPLLHYLAKRTDEKLHGVMTSGTRLPDQWFQEIKKASTFVMQQYGCSEVGCISIATSISEPNDLGKPLTHHHVKAGVITNPAAIYVEKAVEDCNTGDLGYFGKDGHLYFVERVDDVINVAGINVLPHEVEQVLRQHQGVEDVVVYKRRDSLSGERVCAQVVGTGLAIGALREWCASYLAVYQIPKEFDFVEKIQKGANGKVNRKQIGDVYV
ncbi:AMP-binding protein [Shouchella miscanthi]|uniref:AMP-binding protein n=1 Tax=Shouchella miscanthi TaxID=2598861 RepID=UPI001643DF01|nr:AMP-binding protein [Shouchella miscanthi]